MGRSNNRPDAVLQYAEGLVAIGKERSALDSLYDFFVPEERHQRTWSPGCERAAVKFFELCVKFRDRTAFKRGLYECRILTQQTQVESLERVVNHLILEAKQQVEEILESLPGNVDLGGLDIDVVPETALCALDAGENIQGRANLEGNTELTRSISFLWDCYRDCLDILRNNVFVEQLYSDVARHALDFCLLYKRRVEFSRLREFLHSHLVQVQKNVERPSSDFKVDFRIRPDDTASLTLMKEVRAYQLNTAIEMELWMEACLSAREMQLVVEMFKDKKAFDPTEQVDYFDKLTQVFWGTGSPLFHAAALLQKYKVLKNMTGVSREQISLLSTRVLLSTMIIPHNESDLTQLAELLAIEEKDKFLGRESADDVISSILKLPNIPIDRDFISEVKRMSIVNVALEPARQIAALLENCSPLSLASKVNVEMDKLKELSREDYCQYVDGLKCVVAFRVLTKLPSFYDTFSLGSLMRAIPFYSRVEIESIIIESIKCGLLSAKVDHSGGGFICFNFGDVALENGIYSDSDLDIAQNGVENVRKSLLLFHTQLRDAVRAITNNKVQNFGSDRLRWSHSLDKAYKRPDYERIEQLLSDIESHKKHYQKQHEEWLVKKQEEKAQVLNQERVEVAQRLEDANNELEIKRIEEEEAKEKRQKNGCLLRSKLGRGLYERIISELGEDVVLSMDPEVVIKEQLDRLHAETMVEQQKEQQKYTSFDHMVRGLFIMEEMNYYKKMSEDFHSVAEELHAKAENVRIAHEIKEHNESVVRYKDLGPVVASAKTFMELRVEFHADDLKQLTDKWNNKLEKEKIKRLEHRKNQRKRERRNKAEKSRLKREAEEKEHAQAVRLADEARQRQERQNMLKRVHEANMARLGITINSSRHQSATSANAVPVKDQKWFPSNWRNSSQATSTDRAPSGRMVHVHVPKSRVDDHDWREVMKKDKVKVEPALSQPRPGVYVPPALRRQIVSSPQTPVQTQAPTQIPAQTSSQKYVPPARRATTMSRPKPEGTKSGENSRNISGGNWRK